MIDVKIQVSFSGVMKTSKYGRYLFERLLEPDFNMSPLLAAHCKATIELLSMVSYMSGEEIWENRVFSRPRLHASLPII